MSGLESGAVCWFRVRALGTAGRANPFAATDRPPVSFLAWVVIWFAIVLGLSVLSFRRREI